MNRSTMNTSSVSLKEHQSWPKISIVTPNYNYAQFLEQTLRSILAQGYPNLEYIVVDGGSTDNSTHIIETYEHDLAFWVSEKDGGQIDAINKGFSHSSGEIMAWLNSDDMLFPWALKTVAGIFSAFPQIDWLTTLNPAFWDRSGFCIGVDKLPGFSKEAFLDGCYIPWGTQWLGWIQQESTFWRRSLWEKIGSAIPTEFLLAGDFNLWGHFYEYAELYGTPTLLGGIRCQQQQRSRQQQQYHNEAESALQRMRQKLNWAPKVSRKIVLGSKIHRMPKLKVLLFPAYSYSGKTVVRRQPESPDGFWDIEEYRFFYQ